MILARWLVLLLPAFWIACAHPPAQEAVGEAPLLTSLQVIPMGRDSVRFALQVTNTSGRPIELQYSSGQTFDFVVTPAGGGTELWRWSSEMMFTQALRTETLAAGETQTHTATWIPPAGVQAELEVRASLVATNLRAEQVARFRLQ